MIKRIIALIGAAACTGLVVFFDCALLKGFTHGSEQGRAITQGRPPVRFACGRGRVVMAIVRDALLSVSIALGAGIGAEILMWWWELALNAVQLSDNYF